MKVALISDPLWLMQELTTLRRMVVGLVDEMVRVVRVVPQWVEQREDVQTMTCQQVVYGGARWRWLRDVQLRRQATPMRQLEVDVLHLMDGSLQGVGTRLAGAMEVPMVCSVWSSAEVGLLRHHPQGLPGAYMAATPALLEAVQQRVGPHAQVVLAPPGVYSTDAAQHKPLEDPQGTLSCVVVGDGRADEHYMALLWGMAKASEKLPQLMYFFYTVSTDQHQLWQAAEKLNLLEQMTVVPFDPGSRELLMQADVVIQPQPLGSVRSLVLEAMAAGRPIISVADPVLDYLLNGKTAKVLAEPGADDWATALVNLVEQPHKYIELGAGGRNYVRQHHSASAYVTAALKLYRAVATPENIPFEK
ncbi:glycosyltransferase family 4 protein [Planctomycetales bacterium ZRK34]|nr:glycosyltransferase family 4 protein [Planctomycetales bacterium ZRK34]